VWHFRAACFVDERLAMHAALEAGLRSRALHFLLLGTALFMVAPRRDDPSKVVVSTRDLEALHVAQANRLGVRSISPTQAEAVDQRAIEDEVLYREAVRLGLDRGDNVVRQHLVQKALLLAEDMAGATRTPDDSDLRAFYDSTRERWTQGATVHFIHVFANHLDTLRGLDVALQGADISAKGNPPALGDAFPSSRDVTSSREGIAAVYGESFAAAVFAQPVGSWGEPVESKFGWHRVEVVRRDPGHPASFEEVRPALPLEWALDRRHKAIAAFLQRAFDRYEITIDGQKAAPKRPSNRVARRLDPSAED
jgi:hypothetical protein